MSAPQALKDALLRALDEAYESDSTAAERVTIDLGTDAILYEEGEEMPTQAPYKVFVDATDGRTIVMRIAVRNPTPSVWPR